MTMPNPACPVCLDPPEMGLAEKNEHQWFVCPKCGGKFRRWTDEELEILND